MLRKLTTQGPKERSSYTITLPIEWVKKYSLEKSRQVDLSITWSALVIKPEGIEKTKATVDAKVLRHSLTRVIQILYKKGVDEIKLINADTKQTTEIYDIISNRCIGYEIIEHKKDVLIIKDIAKEASENFETLLRRCFLLIIEMSKEQDKELIKKYDQNLNKLHAYCLRLLMKQGHKDYELVTLYSKLCSLLENIGDDFSYMLLFGKRPNKSIREYLETCYDLYYAFSYEKFDEAQKIIGAQRYAKTEYFNDLVTRKINTMLGMIYGIKG